MSIDTALRIFVYDQLLARGTAPSSEEIGRELGISAEDARKTMAGLKIGKTILPHPKTGEIWMAGPFAAKPSEYRVVGSRMSWWANCAWDALGVAVLANEPVRVEAGCADCNAPLAFGVTPTRGVAKDARDLVVHFLLPARRWYDDIGFT